MIRFLWWVLGGIAAALLYIGLTMAADAVWTSPKWKRSLLVGLPMAACILYLFLVVGPFICLWRTGRGWIARRRARASLKQGV